MVAQIIGNNTERSKLLSVNVIFADRVSCLKLHYANLSADASKYFESANRKKFAQNSPLNFPVICS